MDRKDELRKLISDAREAYYNLSPKITDQQYDAWIDELVHISPNDAEIIAIGATPLQHSVWEKVMHEIPMGSLGKVNSENELDEWISKIDGVKEWFITHKIDGSSMELVYEVGKLVRCGTRGDGIIGENVTANVSKIPSIPKTLSIPVNVVVRGEVVMLKSTFAAKYSEEYANPRNTAAGKVREKKGGGEACKDLEFLAYWIYFKNQNDNVPKTMNASFQWLEDQKFEVPPIGVSNNIDVIKTVYAEAVKHRENIHYEIDGMVVSINDLQKLDGMGSLNGRPKGQIAWKFDPSMRETKVVNVKWQVGSSGRITPVAVVEPIDVGGVTITNVSLHNLSMFRDLKLFSGCRVLISRRNDVIPFLERNLDLDNYP